MDESSSSSLGADYVGARVPKQQRSRETRLKITQAAVEILAEAGIAGLSHRIVARRANVSLSATTYYFSSKADIVAAAAAMVLDDYSEAFSEMATRIRAGESRLPSFRDFAIERVQNSSGPHWHGVLSWGEITLDAVRHEESLRLTREWHDRLKLLWTDIALALNVANAPETAQSGIDLVVGLLFMCIGLHLNAEEIGLLLRGHSNPFEAWSSGGTKECSATRKERGDSKGAHTRRALIDAAIQILISDGAAALSHRSIAVRAGVSNTTPSYYFACIDDILQIAQAELFERSKDRYRSAMAGFDFRNADIEQIIEVTNVVFVREVIEHGKRNLASYTIWIEAARRADLQPMVWSAVADQCEAWNSLVAPLSRHHRSLDGLLLQALFIGKSIRILSTGARTADLVAARSEFARDIRQIVEGRYWIQAHD
ncbi:TetR family transcriptional regulator [bacterium]|nr:TetR family transcriptional regulator [bacterium]